MGAIRTKFKKWLIPILASIPVLGLVFLGIAELYGWSNFINVSFPLNSTQAGQISGAILSVFLTYALVILYWQQKELLRRQHEPYLTGEVTTLNIVSSQFKIRNTGNAPAYDVTASWEIADQSRTWEIPTLVPDDSFGFPILVDEEDNWLLNTTEIEEYLDENNEDGAIEYKITCNNPQDKLRTFRGSVDFSVLSTRSEANEIWETEPLEEVSNEIKKMRKDIQKISRYTEREKGNNRGRQRRNRLRYYYPTSTSLAL